MTERRQLRLKQFWTPKRKRSLLELVEEYLDIKSPEQPFYQRVAIEYQITTQQAAEKCWAMGYDEITGRPLPL